MKNFYKHSYKIGGNRDISDDDFQEELIEYSKILRTIPLIASADDVRRILKRFLRRKKWCHAIREAVYGYIYKRYNQCPDCELGWRHDGLKSLGMCETCNGHGAL
jgi:hypothetical protein